MTIPLIIGRRQIDTVFDLLGFSENDLTYALGWALAKADGFAASLMHNVFGENVGEVLGVSLQRFAQPDGGFSDIEISATSAHLIIEAKKGWRVPGNAQLDRYSARPDGEIASRLLSVSAASQQWALRQLPRVSGDVRVDHRSWDDLAQLAEKMSHSGSHASRRLLREVEHYLKGASRMQSVSSNWAYCVVLGRDAVAGSDLKLRDIPLVHHKYCHPYDKHWPSEPPNYLAFRWDGRVRQFNHVDRVAIVDDLAEALPGLIDRGTIVGPHAVYDLGPPIELPTPLKNGSKYRATHVEVMIDLLFTSETLKAAVAASRQRRDAAGGSPEPQ